MNGYIESDVDPTKFVTADTPKVISKHGILAPSPIAYLLTKKFRWGMLFHRIAAELASEAAGLDDGTMCLYAEQVGAALGGRPRRAAVGGERPPSIDVPHAKDQARSGFVRSEMRVCRT